ncbi:MarR family winged helix-turn-helix transcriptional regulator [Amycolatopsis circi]|uniref:MarR family winged helix-turn-helix transcriptional regulator n=1 Tax=Amycolatopsis circi TaxID=871959 RepID=UPI000E25A675|nr:MarR family transcriptional regulator [Amycolatopsis circi]
MADVDLADQLLALARLVKRAEAAPAEPNCLPLLAMLAEEGPFRAGEIAAVLGVNPSTVSRQVAGLVRSGLVERRADPEDGRASPLFVTAAGRRILEVERQRRAAQFGDALSGWSPEERARFADLLGCFVRDLRRSGALPGK